MGKEIDLLVNYPKTKRNLDERAASKTEEDRRIVGLRDDQFGNAPGTVEVDGQQHLPLPDLRPEIHQIAGGRKRFRTVKQGERCRPAWTVWCTGRTATGFPFNSFASAVR